MAATRSFRRLGVLSILSLTLGSLGGVGLLAGPAQAAPGNDALAGAAPLAVGAPVTADPTGAGVEPGEEDLDGCSDIASTLWYAVTPATTGSYVVQTSGAAASYDSILDVFHADSAGSPTPDIEDLVNDACNDDSGVGKLSPQAQVDLTGGTTYYVRLALHASGPTPGPVQLVVSPAVAPDDDALASATPVSSGSTTDVNDISATVQPGESFDADCDDMVGTVWLRWTATGTGAVTFSTQDGSDDPDTMIAVWSGPASGATPGSLNSVDCNDDGPGNGLTSVLKVKVTAGKTYYVQAAAVDEEDQGSFQVVTGSVVAVPKAAAKMAVHAPKKVKAGQRPVVKVAVTRAGKAGIGSVTFTVNGGSPRKVSLAKGVAHVKLSALRPGRYKVVAVYSGDDTTTGVTVRTTIKVVKKPASHRA